MEPTDLTIEILKDIRDDIRTLNRGQTELRDEVRELRRGQTELRDEVRELKQAHVATEMRLATELVAVVGALEDVKILLRENYASTIRDLERRVTALENRAGV